MYCMYVGEGPYAEKPGDINTAVIPRQQVGRSVGMMMKCMTYACMYVCMYEQKAVEIDRLVSYGKPVVTILMEGK